MDCEGRHIDLMVALQEEADPQRTVLTLAANLQNESHDMRRRGVGVVSRAALAVSKADQPGSPVASEPAGKDRPRDAEEPARPAYVSGHLLVFPASSVEESGGLLLRVTHSVEEEPMGSYHFDFATTGQQHVPPLHFQQAHN